MRIMATALMIRRFRGKRRYQRISVMLSFMKKNILCPIFLAMALLGMTLPQLSFADPVPQQHEQHKTKKKVVKAKSNHKAHHHKHHHTAKHKAKHRKAQIRNEPMGGEEDSADDETSEVSDVTENPTPTQVSETSEALTTPAKPSSIPAYFLASQHSFRNATGLMASMEHKVVDFVHNTVNNLRYSSYKLGGKKFDSSRGVYVVDCSNFVDNILQHVSPHAYNNLVNATGADTPTTLHYYEFFSELSADSSAGYWSKITDIEQLRAGDIIVFRNKNSRGIQIGGHVMVVMEKPIRDDDVFFVRVADSAPTRHSEDTRQLNESGIGIGTLLLKANPKTGHPSAYAWAQGSYWKKNVSFAMARPVDISKI